MTYDRNRPADAGPDLLRRQVQRFVRGFGLLADDRTPCGTAVSPREAHALMIVLERNRQGNPLRQNDLASALGIDKSNVTRLVQRLERSGRIQQHRSEEDGRARILSLTAKGMRLAEAIDQSSHSRFETVLAGIPSEHHARVFGALELLNEAIQMRPPENGTAESKKGRHSR